MKQIPRYNIFALKKTCTVCDYAEARTPRRPFPSLLVAHSHNFQYDFVLIHNVKKCLTWDMLESPGRPFLWLIPELWYIKQVAVIDKCCPVRYTWTYRLYRHYPSIHTMVRNTLYKTCICKHFVAFLFIPGHHRQTLMMKYWYYVTKV